MTLKRFRSYRQLESSDCGLACVRMLARHYGKKIPLQSLRHLTETSKLGVTVKDITDSLRAIGMETAAVAISDAEMQRMPCPAIIYWRQRHFVVLYHIDHKRHLYYVADPAEGKLRFPQQEFMQYWKGDAAQGVAIVAEPGDDWDSVTFPKPRIFKGLFSIVKRELLSHKKRFAAVVLLSLLCMAADLAMPLLLQSTVDDGIALRNVGLVWMLIAGQLAVFLGSSLSNNILQYLIVQLGLRIDLSMKLDFLRKLISFPLSFFDRKSSSELIQKTDDQSRIKDFILEMPQSTFFVVLNMIVFSGLLLWYNAQLFAIFMIFTLGEALWTTMFLNRRKAIDYSYFTHSAESRNQIYELINGMTDIKTGGAQNQRIGLWEKTQGEIIRLTQKFTVVNQAMDSGRSVISRIKEIVITGICATLVIKGELTFGEMLTVGYVVGRLAAPFQNIMAMVAETQDAAVSYERLDEILNDHAEAQGKGDFETSAMRLADVSFKYPGSSNPYVIKNLSLDIEPGRFTAIVGKSGCGKSTLIKLLLGFYVPQKGQLTLGGTDVSDLDRDKWCKHCAAVMQNGYIFSDSIAGNIALSGDADKTRIEECLRQVCLYDFVRKLPMGIHTRIGSTGLALSGGQQQRLLIARALYSEPDILFLDEATSSLDACNEQTVTDNIMRSLRGKTLVVAAHRLSTIRRADRIIFMENGRIAEQGTHEQLITLKGKYFDLVSNQLEHETATPRTPGGKCGVEI